MKTIVTIVEGDGEVHALPILLRRLNKWKTPTLFCNVVQPIRVRRDRFLNREDEFKRILELAALKCGASGWILILLDADDECPKKLGQEIYSRARLVVPHHPISVVLAKHEYEAWFLAAVRSINGQRGLFVDEGDLPDAESVRGAKEWSSKRIPKGRYRELIDQPAFSARMNLEEAQNNSRSFQKLCSEWDRNFV